MNRPLLSAVLSAVLAVTATVDAPAQPPVGYVGSAVCAGCHDGKYAQWKDTLHANVIRDAKKEPEAILGDFTVEDLGFKKEDVLYTVGSHWDQRYMTRIGNDLYVLPKLWSVQSKQWRPYNVWSWKQRPWSKQCAGCHVTGLDASDGAYSEMRIGCESCHGPGAAHARSKELKDVVNPAKLPRDRRDMVCAACHVRGKDVTDAYYFPVGYLPGDDLGKFLVPLDIEEGEEPAAAIARLYKAWEEQREESGRGKCEVCGIYGSSDKLRDKSKMSEDVMSYCFKCHEFGQKYASHSHHPEAAKLVCLDCHRPKPFSAEKAVRGDIHSVAYYRIHQDSCYDENIDLACISCHAHQDRDRAWASSTILIEWRKLPALDH